MAPGGISTTLAPASTADDVKQVIQAAGAKLAALRAAGQHKASHTLCRSVEHATCCALARLQLERDAALRAGVPSLVAAAEAEMAELERLFHAHGFEAWVTEQAAPRSKDAPAKLQCEREERGVSAGAALCVSLVVLLAASLGLGVA